MEQREKLIEIMTECPVITISSYESICKLIDHLLANGVTVLPCRCCECDYHDHDGGTGYCNYWNRWSNMSDYCNHAKRKGGDE